MKRWPDLYKNHVRKPSAFKQGMNGLSTTISMPQKARGLCGHHPFVLSLLKMTFFMTDVEVAEPTKPPLMNDSIPYTQETNGNASKLFLII
jgi:hypothetical protein